MNRFLALGDREPQPAEKKPSTNLRQLDGTFQCQYCDEYVYSALWAPDTNELGWKCSKDHLSRIEDFTL